MKEGKGRGGMSLCYALLEEYALLKEYRVYPNKIITQDLLNVRKLAFWDFLALYCLN